MLNWIKKLSYAQKIWIAIGIYFILFSYLSSMRYLSGYLGDPDIATFKQTVHTTAFNRMLLYNTFEERSHFRFRNPHMPKEELLENLKTMDGRTHFAVHNSPVFFPLALIYRFFNSLVFMISFQVLITALGAWAIFLIGRHLMDERTGFLFGILYLINFPLHGITYDPFHELGYVIGPILFSFYFLLKKRFAPFWLMILITLSCKEDLGFMVASYGLYIIYMAWRERRETPFLKNRLSIQGMLVFVAGTAWLLISIYWIIPAFRGTGYHFFAERYGHLGNSFGSAVRNMILKPHIVIGNLLQYPKFTFFMEMVAPFAFLSFFDLPTFMVSWPNFVVNLSSSFTVMYNTGSRYPATILPFCMISALMGFHNVLKKAKDEEHRNRLYRRFMNTAFFISIAGMLFFNPSPVRIGWKVPKITEHRRITWDMAKKIPPTAGVSTQVDLYLYTAGRPDVYVGYRENTEYILVDLGSNGKYTMDRSGKISFNPENHWFIEGADWDAVLPDLLKQGKYEILEEKDGVLLLRKKEL